MKHYLYILFSFLFSSTIDSLATSYPGSFTAQYKYYKSTGETLVIELGSNGSNEVYIAKSSSAASTPDFVSVVKIDSGSLRQEVAANNTISILAVNMNSIISKKIDLSFFNVIASQHQQACGEQHHLVPELIIDFKNNKLKATLGSSYRTSSSPWLSWLQDEIPNSITVNSNGVLSSILDGSNTIFQIQNISTSYQSPTVESYLPTSTTIFVEESKSEQAAHTMLGKNITQYFESKNSATVLSWLNTNKTSISTLLKNEGKLFYEKNKALPELINLKSTIANNMPQTIQALRGTLIADMKESVNIAALYPSTNDLPTNVYNLFIDDFNEGIISQILDEIENEHQ